MTVFADKLKEANYKKHEMTDLEKIKLQYGLAVLKNEGIKFIIFFILFGFIGMLKPFLLCMLINSTVRVFAGGIHMETNVGCFFFSLLILMAEIIVLPALPVPPATYIILIIISTFIIILLAPIASKKKPFKGKERYRFCKRMSIAFSILWCIILICLISSSVSGVCGAWVVILQAVQMMILAITNKFNLKETANVQKNQ